MAVLSFIFLAFLAGSSWSESLDSRIVGGTPTTVEQWPSIVQVETLRGAAWYQTCAANVLNSLYVLSAAHCFSGKLYAAERTRVRAGATYRNTGGVVLYVDKEINHPSYGVASYYDGDISVVRLKDFIVYSPSIQQGIYIAAGAYIPDNLPVVHAGWGATSEDGPYSPVLLETTIFTINRELCASRYLSLPTPQVVTENMICAGLLDVGGRDNCQGDSGGPLYYTDIIIGVISWGYGCGNGTYPGVSAAVSPYINWVASVAV